MRILFVCTGNTCRSSMAQVLAEKTARELNLEGWEFLSAGTWAMPGAAASLNAVRVMEEQGLDLKAHKARRLALEMVEECDLILTMTHSHKDYVCELFPEAAPKVHTLFEYACGNPGDVDDPYGGDEGVYRQSAAQIKDAIDGVISKLSENNRV